MASQKSSLIFRISPIDTETNMKELEELVRAISIPGLQWKAADFQDIAYGIKCLRISCIIEDELVSVDALEEKINEIDSHVQSVTIEAFNKI